MSKIKFINQVVHSDPDIMGGELVFKGTRVPVQILFDYLKSSSVEAFLKGYPHISREMVEAVLDWAQQKLIPHRQPALYENAA